MIQSTPLRKGQVYEIAIHGLGHSGEGVGRVENFTVFVDGAIPGDVVNGRIYEVKKNFARAKVEKVLESSIDRVTPTCPHYERCGGCQLQHMDYSAQLRWKRQQVVDALERIGGLKDVSVAETLGMESPLYYRNKAQYPVGRQHDEIVMGFFERGTHQIVDLAGCQIEQSVNSEILAESRRLIKQLNMSVYDETTGTGDIRHIVVRSSRTTGQAMVVIVTNGKKVAGLQEFLAQLVKSVPSVISVAQNVNTRKTNIIFGDETSILWGQPGIIDKIRDLNFLISPRSFFQVNPVQTEVLYEKALSFAQLTGTENVFDLYCGIGTITLFLARASNSAIGIDDVPEAIEDAKQNANLNNIQNAQFIAGKVEVELPRLVKEGHTADIIVVDPPRAGCAEVVLETILGRKPKRIVYVSCNPSTLARDLAYLTKSGEYRIIEAQPVDMFPHTSHVETVCLLTRK